MNFPSRSRLAVAARWLFAACLAAVTFCAGGIYAGPTDTKPTDGHRPIYSLQECLDLAERQNPDVLIAAKGIETAKAGVTQARAGIFPTLAATGYYQRRERDIATSGGVTNGVRQNDYTADVRLTQLIFSSFAVRNRIAAAHLTERIARLNYDAALNLVRGAVKEAFYSTLSAEASVAVRQQAVDLLNAQLKDQQDRLAAGTAGQINVNRAQVSLANEQAPLLDAQASIRTAYAALAQLLGVAYPTGAAEAPFRVRGSLEVRPFNLSQEECIRRALDQRPEVGARKLTLDVLKHQLVVEKAGTRPQVSAFAAYDVYSEPLVAASKDTFSGYTVGVQASWTVFDGFLTLGRVRGVRAQQGEATAQLVAIRLTVETEVRNALTELRTAEATLRPQAQNITLATETLNLTSKNFDAGLGTQIDVLQTRVDLTRAQTQELTGRLAYNVALARLERAMAVGVPAPDDGSLKSPSIVVKPATAVK